MKLRKFISVLEEFAKTRPGTLDHEVVVRNINDVMVCPKCAGSATLYRPVLDGSCSWVDGEGRWQMAPCPECQGSGIVSCCDTAGASAPKNLADEGWGGEILGEPGPKK